MIAFLGYLNWLYITEKYRLVNIDIDLHEVRHRKIMFMSGMILAAIAMGLSFLNTIASIGVFVVVLISLVIINTVRYRIRVAEQAVK
jgi:hypothetical protein